MSIRIIVADDEPNQLELLTFNLVQAEYEVIRAENGRQALDMIEEHRPDLVIIDWMMPQVSGLELCRRLRRNPNTASIPLILLTAREEENAKITGLGVADDYITKPFSPRELVARLKAILRRTTPKGIEEVVEFSNLALDPISRKVTASGNLVVLSPIEYRLLQVFMTNPDRAFSRAQLLDRVWGGVVYVGERTVDVHIWRLRKALGSDLESMIQTVRGTGYRFSTITLDPVR